MSALSSPSMYWAITPSDLCNCEHTRREKSQLSIPNRSDPYLKTLWIVQQILEKLEKALQVLLETLHDALKHGEQNVSTNFTMGDLWRGRRLVKKGKELSPGTGRDLNCCDRGNNTCCRVTNELTGQEISHCMFVRVMKTNLGSARIIPGNFSLISSRSSAVTWSHKSELFCATRFRNSTAASCRILTRVIGTILRGEQCDTHRNFRCTCNYTRKGGDASGDFVEFCVETSSCLDINNSEFWRDTSL